MVRLVPMDPGDFDPFFERLLREYADEHIRSGRWTQQEGLTKAQEEIRNLLPAGRETPNHFFFTIVVGPPDEKVGAVWLAIEPRGGFVYDLLVLEPYRRRGYAEEAMLLAERVAREKGALKISLHVFGSNQGARKLYTKLGYSETNVMMSKSLTP
jgi:ribosomal protein S18 acetylase RimI-like enzyme